MSFSDRMSNGWNITMNSFKVLRENKSLVLFPILSSISLILIVASFCTAVVAANGWNIENIDIEPPSKAEAYLYSFIYYIVNYFVVVFFNMALVHCTKLYFQGEKPTIRQGIQFSLSRIGTIFSWAIFAATIGTILKAIQEESGLVGKIITGIIGIVWSIATFFVVPVIAYENLGPIAAVKRSSQIMKEKWGESLVAGFSFGLINFIAMIVVAIPLFLVGSIYNPIAGIILAVLGVFIVLSILSAAHTVFVSAVYHNITGDPVKHFEQQMLDNLFDTKRKD